MTQESQHPRDTREFMAMWNVAREEHLARRIAGLVRRLSERGVLPAMDEAQGGVLAHALHLAADPAAGPAAALQFLESLAGAEGADDAGV